MTRVFNRLDLLLAHRPRDGICIEVAPYFNPALPKAKGNNVLILDVFDTETLRQYAKDDPNIPDDRIGEIEQVDIVGDASRIAELAKAHGISGDVEFVVSSHNFEHLPDPIRFLRGVEEILKPGGILSMAIPDYRATFDHFRSPTRLIDWLSAFHDQATRPSPETLFDLAANAAKFSATEVASGTCDWRIAHPRNVWLSGDLRKAYDQWILDRSAPQAYRDTHVSVIFGTQFELMVEDLRHLGLISLEIMEVSSNFGHEFFAHLRKPRNPAEPHNPEEYAVRREQLLRKLMTEIGSNAFPAAKPSVRKLLHPKSVLMRLLGAERYHRIRAWNRKRIGR